MSPAPPIQFLLGPAGSGKTFTCLAEIRAELKRSPDGPPLMLLAPKQATYQLERQLLEDDDDLQGYTRLHILSFERLAQFVLRSLDQPEPTLLDEEGRVMVLRALLLRRAKDLKIFCAPARLPGFAQQLGQILRELRRARLNPARLRELAARSGRSPQLLDKLHDLALLMSDYEAWLQANVLRDADQLLDIAAAVLRQPPAGATIPRLGGLWLDGFAEMAPQELELLTALLPHCERATLALCLEEAPEADPSWLSTWSVVAQTFRRCRLALEPLSNMAVKIQAPGRNPKAGRFVGSEDLAHLERAWTSGAPSASIQSPSDIRIVSCPSPEAEATLAAREVLRFVRSEPTRRFRDCAVLLRSHDGYHDALRRAFTRHGIPFFLDRREPVTHHPLAELTRFAMRVAAYNWRHDDWFGALKTGLVPSFGEQIDQLENIALEYGLEGGAWRVPLVLKATDENEREHSRVKENHSFEPVRKKLVVPFARFADAVVGEPTGCKLAAAIRELWQKLRVPTRLEQWSRGDAGEKEALGQVHATVWQQMQDWLENVERAFPAEALPLREWLPILEAGLAGLSVGVVPPALDHVLIGTVDRSRNPDLKLSLVLGMNEAVFPAPSSTPPLLTEAERQSLDDEGVFLGPSARHRLGHERYYGYIACTRARERLVLSCAEVDAEGRKLNPSPFIAHLQRLFPGLALEKFPGETTWREVEHPCELLPDVLRNAGAPPDAQDPTLKVLASRPEFAPAVLRQQQLAEAMQQTRVLPQWIEAIHGPELKSSVSRLEDFAGCPFKFFVASTLGAKEREKFEVDVRQLGSFQHELLSRFHLGVAAEKKQWRDLAPAEAIARLHVLGETLTKTYAGGRFAATASSRFTAQVLIAATVRLMETLIGWMAQYEFDPVAVEVGFGLPGSELPAWTLELDEWHRLTLRGRIDRVDLCVGADGSRLAVVIDYKSSPHKLDAVKLHHCLQLQLPAYLAALEQLSGAAAHFHASQIVPAGMFYVNLRGAFGKTVKRSEMLDSAEQAKERHGGYQHRGLFDDAQRHRLDNRGENKGDQFKYTFTNKGLPWKGRAQDGVSSAQFRVQLEQVREHLVALGREIFSGTAEVSPYRLGSGSNSKTACDWCEFRGVCRFDPWVDQYRLLKPVPQTDAANGGKAEAAE